MGEYPWLTAHCGDFDITGHRRPVSYWREIVWGLRADAVPRGASARAPRRSNVVPAAGWSFTDAVASWSWPGFEDQPVTVEVYADADEVELLLERHASRSGSPRAESHRFRGRVRDHLRARRARSRSRTATARRPVACRWSRRAGRCCSTCGSTARAIDADDRDLAYVEIALVDADGNVHIGEDRAVTVAVDGPAVLQGLGSGNPCTEETFGSPTHDTFDGRALAVIRPTGPGTITVTVSAKDCDDRTVDHRGRATRDLGAALAPVPGRVGALHRAPRRAPVDRRDRRRRRARRCPTTTRWRRSGGASTPPTPTTAACSCSPTTSRCSPPTRPSRSAATTCTAPGGRSAPPRSSATTTTPRSRWPTSTTTKSTAVVRTWRDRTAALQASTVSPTC